MENPLWSFNHPTGVLRWNSGLSALSTLFFSIYSSAFWHVYILWPPSVWLDCFFGCAVKEVQLMWHEYERNLVAYLAYLILWYSCNSLASRKLEIQIIFISRPQEDQTAHTPLFIWGVGGFYQKFCYISLNIGNQFRFLLPYIEYHSVYCACSNWCSL